MKKILVFSDTHLGKKFDYKKFSVLKNLIENSDQVIINGDFWDNAEVSFDQFINSKWSKLFKLLKSKKAIYIFGNHDRKIDSDDRISLFCDKACNQHLFTNGKYKYHVEHGHLDSLIYKLGYKIFGRVPKLMKYLTLPVHFSLVINEILVSKNINAFSFANKKFRNKLKESILITGHSHSPEINLSKNYINSGFMRRGIYCYVEITDKPRLIKRKFSSF